MNGPFDSDVMDEADATDAVDEDSGEGAAFDEGDAGDGFTDTFEAGAFDAGDAEAGDEAFEGDSAADLGDSFTDAGDDMALWNAFEEEVADGLDAGDVDEFLGRLLGGLGRAAGVAGRGLGRAAGAAGRVGSFAQSVGNVAGQVGRVAGRVSPAAEAASRLAGMLGAPGVAGALGQVGRAAQGVSGAAGRVQGLAGSVGQAAGGAQGLFGQLSQLLGQGFDELEAFDAAADLYVEDGVDEALPAAVALAARAAARGLGFRNMAHLSQAGRRALMRGVAAAARELVRNRGPQAVRALPRLAQAATRAAQRGAATPARAVQTVRRGLPAAARRVAQNPALMRRMVQPGRTGAPQGRGRPRPLARPSNIGFGVPPARARGARTYTFGGPVTLTITPR